MAINLNIQIEGEQSIDRLLDFGTRDSLPYNIKNAAPFWGWVADNVMQPAITINYKSGGARSGKKWAYTDAEKKHYLPMKRGVLGKSNAAHVLRWKGGKERLFPSFTDKTHAEHVRNVSDSGAEVGSKVPYAKNHQRGIGSYRGKYKTPQRRIAFLKESDKQIVVKGLQRWIITGVVPKTKVTS